MKSRKFFKCRLCPKQLDCVINTYGDGETGGTCRYGTGWSIYKWTIRILAMIALSIGLAVIIWSFIRIPHMFKADGLVSNNSKDTIAIVILAVLLISAIIYIIVSLPDVHADFKRNGGSIWGKE